MKDLQDGSLTKAVSLKEQQFYTGEVSQPWAWLGRTRPTEATPSPRTQTVRKGGMQVQNRAQTRIFSCTLVKLLRVMTYEHKFKFFVIKKNIYLRRTIRGYLLFGKVSPLPASMFNFPYIFCERFGVHDLFLHLLSPRKLHFHLFLSFNCTPFSISFII